MFKPDFIFALVLSSPAIAFLVYFVVNLVGALL